MERIVIEVSPNVAQAWRKMPAKEKRELGNEVSVRIGRKYFKESKAEQKLTRRTEKQHAEIKTAKETYFCWSGVCHFLKANESVEKPIFQS